MSKVKEQFEVIVFAALLMLAAGIWLHVFKLLGWI